MSSQGGIGLGGFPTPRSARMAAGDYPGNSNDPQAVLKSIDSSLVAIANKLVPIQYRARQSFNALAIGTTTPGLKVDFDTFNGILVGLTQGIVDIYLNGIWFMQVSAAGNPINVFLPTTNISGLFTFTCNTASTTTATGFIDIMQY